MRLLRYARKDGFGIASTFQRKRRRRESVQGLAFVFPALSVLGIFGILPLLYAAGLSVQQTRDGASRFVGLEHYGDALSSDAFRDSVLVTVYFALGTVPVALVLSLVIALALFRLRRFAGILRAMVFLPYVTSVVASAMVWRVLFQPREGIANVVIESLGFPAQTWLLEPRGVLHLLSGGVVDPGVGPSLALVCVMIFEVWRSCGFMVVLLLAGLAAVPRELEQAARLDGASPWRVTRDITLPLLSPTLFFLAVVGAIQSLQAFSSLYAMTGNGRGPLDTTQSLTVYVFTSFYDQGRIEYGAAVAVLLALGIMAFTGLQWRALGSRVHYE